MQDTKLSRTLNDGFQEMFTFRGHKLCVRGFSCVDSFEDKKATGIEIRKYKEPEFVSWDSKTVLVWERYGIKYRHKFDSKKMSIGTVVYLPRHKVFLAAANDFTFRVFGRRFDLIAFIPHQERAILAMEYDFENNLLLMSGSCGVSVWNFSRNITEEASFTLEKLFTFEGCTDWTNNIIFDQKTNRAFVLNDRNLSVISFKKRSIITRIDNAHESPLTRACWYPRSLVYITACSRGLIRCWTSHHNIKGTAAGGLGAGEKEGTQPVQDDEMSGKKFSLIHTFRVHTSAVTGLELHPVSGLLISASLDGYIKVLNLELFSELFSLKLDDGISFLKNIRYHGAVTCLFAHTNGVIRVWKVTSCCDYFMNCGYTVQRLVATDSPDYMEELVALSEVEREMSKTSDADSVSRVRARRASLNLHHQQQSHEPQQTLRQSGFVTAYAGQDLRVMSETGALVSRVEPECIVDPVLYDALSLSQELLFCLMETGILNVFCIRSLQATPIKSIAITGVTSTDMITSMVLIQVTPQDSIRGTDQQWGTGGEDLRGNRTTEEGGLEEFVMMGTSNGALICLDTMRSMETIYTVQAHAGPVVSILSRPLRRELITFGYKASESEMTVKIWKLPDMTTIHEIPGLFQISCWGASATLGLFALGNSSGYVHLYQPIEKQLLPLEVLREGHQHDSKVLCMSFCDYLRVFATSSEDRSIKIWDYDKRLVRTVVFNVPSPAILFNGMNGDLLITQRTYVLCTSRRIWDEGDVLRSLRSKGDPWGIEHTRAELMKVEEVYSKADMAMLAKLNLNYAVDGKGGGSGSAENWECEKVFPSGSHHSIHLSQQHQSMFTDYHLHSSAVADDSNGNRMGGGPALEHSFQAGNYSKTRAMAESRDNVLSNTQIRTYNVLSPRGRPDAPT